MSELSFEVPDGGFRRGDIVFSKNHGRGVWHQGECPYVDGLGHPVPTSPHIFSESWGGKPFWYTPDGRYFTDGAFKDKECVVALERRA